MDGERALWDAQAVYFPEAVGVLDLFHVLERLWAVAHRFHKEGSDESKGFVEQRLRDLLQGRVGYVISGLRRRLKAEKLSGARRRWWHRRWSTWRTTRPTCGTTSTFARATHRQRSGGGGCRHLVKDRMEQTGMRWTMEGGRRCSTFGRCTSTTSGKSSRSTVWSRSKPGCTSDLRHSVERVTPDW